MYYKWLAIFQLGSLALLMEGSVHEKSISEQGMIRFSTGLDAYTDLKHHTDRTYNMVRKVIKNQ